MVICDTALVSFGDASAHVLVVGDVAKTLKISAEAVDDIAGPSARVVRTVLRSEVLRILAAGPLDLMVTASDASFLGGDEFLAAFSARVLPVSLLMLTRTVDELTRERLRSAGVQVEHVAPPIALEALRERVSQSLHRRRLTSTALREPLPSLVKRVQSECGSFTLHVHAGAEYGSLTFLGGTLVDAQNARHTGAPAARDILGWRDTNVVFDRMVPSAPRSQRLDLDTLLAEAKQADRPLESAHHNVSNATASEEILPPPNIVPRPVEAELQTSPPPTSVASPRASSTRIEYDMANIQKTLEEAMKIDGAIGAAIADWDSGLCLGTAGGGHRLNVEVAAAGNCQVVKAKMATMNELGIKGTIHDILITLEDQIHLIRPLHRGENMFIYLAIDKAKGNLAMARHRLSKLETELSV